MPSYSPEFIKTPIVLVSASANVKVAEVMAMNALNGYLSKPVDRRQLLEQLAKFLPHRNASEPVAESKAQGKFTPAALPEKAKSRLPELIGLLDAEMTAHWDDLQKKRLVKDIELFARRMTNLGEEFDILAVREYGERIIAAVEAFDVPRMKKNLNQFPALINDLKHLV